MKLRIIIFLILALLVVFGAYWARSKFAAKRIPKARVIPSTVNGYEVLHGCRYVPHNNNDGDSFHVSHGDRKFELRLYYVDAAETYLSDRLDSQRKRVKEQAEYFGITSNQATVLGRQAAKHTRQILASQSFTVYTKWEPVFDSGRYYGFVSMPGESETYLSQNLVENGLVRIYTRGDATPHGKAFWTYRKFLEQLQQKAQKSRIGGWGIR